MIEQSSFLTRQIDDEDTAGFWKRPETSPTQSAAGSHTSAVQTALANVHHVVFPAEEKDGDLQRQYSQAVLLKEESSQ